MKNFYKYLKEVYNIDIYFIKGECFKMIRNGFCFVDCFKIFKMFLCLMYLFDWKKNWNKNYIVFILNIVNDYDI